MRGISLFAAAACAAAVCEAAVRIDVRPGDSLAAAVGRIRAMTPLERADGVEVVFAPGDYFVGKTLDIGGIGGVSAARPVVFRAAEPGTARILGGRIIPAASFAAETDPAVLAKLPAGARVFATDLDWRSPTGGPVVFIGGRIGKPARWPNAGYTSFSNAVDVGVKVGDNKYRNGAFIYDDPRAKRWDFSRGVRMNGYWTHDWAYDSAVARSYGTENGTNNVLRLGCDIPYGICGGKTLGGKSVRRFMVCNLLEELDAPGEYFYDAGKRRLYVAVGDAGLVGLGEIAAANGWTAGVIVSGKGVRNVVFRGLAFACRAGGLVTVTDGENVTFDGCRFRSTCNVALSLNGVRMTVRDCDVSDIGGIGIGIGGGDRTTLARSDNLVENCRIRRYAQTHRTYRAGIDVSGVGATVRGCSISDAPHMGIRYGGNDHVFEFNDICRVLQETSDAGAVYTGRNWTHQGVIHRYNHFHDIGSPGMSVVAIYFDDCESGAQVYGNVFRCARGVLVGGGRDHPIRNNIFIGCRKAILLDDRGHCWPSFIKPPPKSSMDMVWKLNQSAWKSEAWQSRYPRLAHILDGGNPFDPLYNDITGNVFIDCTEEVVHLEGLREKLAAALAKTELADNWVFTSPGRSAAAVDPIVARGFTCMTNCADVGFADAAKGDYRLRAGGVLETKLPWLRKLPLERILRLGETTADPKLARMFAGKEDVGLRVFPSGRSHSPGADLLSREGFPIRFTGEGPVFVFGAAAEKLDAREMEAGAVLDRAAARILAAHGVKSDGAKSAVLDFDADSVDFGHYEPGLRRAAILAAYRRAAGTDPEIRFEVPIVDRYDDRFRAVVKRDPKTGRYAALIENLEDRPLDVRFVTPRIPAIAETLRGTFKVSGDQLLLKDLAPHASAAVTFDLTERTARPYDLDLGELKGPELWGGRKAHPAVVNPVTGSDPANVLSLRGEWEFRTVPSLPRFSYFGRRKQLTEAKPWSRKIRVPACWEAQGVGKPAMSDCWDIKEDENAKPIRHAYWGTALYRKRVTIPAAWRSKRIWLKVGGAKSVGWFFVGREAVACVDSFCGTYKYDITDLVTPGEEAIVSAGVRNDVPSRKGLFSGMNRWGGLYRDVELEATPETLIDDAWVRGDFGAKSAEVHVAVAGPGDAGRGMSLKVSVGSEVVETRLGQSRDLTVSVPLRDFRPWSPECPNLYTARVDLVSNGTVLQTRFERFGVRKLEVRGDRFYLNDRPFFFRGFGDDHVYPLTGITPADVDAHRAHLALAHRAGFNYVRLHTHTELPEYFEAADEAGILVEAELPYYNDMPAEGQVFDPIRDVTELWEHYRRYPSFAIYSMGNEGSFGPKLDRAIHAYVKKMDPDRLKINQDCHIPGTNPPESSDFVGGPLFMWPRASFDPGRPFVTHEYLNLGAKQDSRLEPRYTGVWEAPVSRAKRAAWLGKFGLDLAWGDRLQDAQHALQRVWQKRGIECARTDPFCDGFCDWTIVDVVVACRGTFSAQGLFNPFWERKERSFSADEFRVFNRPVGLFCDFRPDRRTFAAGERIDLDFILANFGTVPLERATVNWSLVAAGKTLAQGTVPVSGTLALGNARKIASVSVAAPPLERPARVVFACALATASGNRTVDQTDNRYDLWLFPKRMPRREPKLAIDAAFASALRGRYAGTLPAGRAAEADVVIAPYGSPLASEALARGQSVVTLASCEGAPDVKLGWWSMGSQVGTAFRDHPAFGQLPHSGVLDELFFRLVRKGGRPLPYAGLKIGDLLAVGEGGSTCSLYLAQARVGKGRVLMAFGLDVLSDTPEGAVLLDGFVDYLRSPACVPESEITFSSGSDPKTSTRRDK